MKIVRKLGTNFQIRSGGNSPNPTWSSAGDGTMLVDMSGLNKVDLSGDKTVVRVGTGNRWQRVYKILDLVGVTVAGGRIAFVGVGGLILGGESSCMMANIYSTS